MPCPMCGSEIDGSHKFGCVNYVGTHDGVDRFLSDAQLASLRKIWRGTSIKMPEEDNTDIRVEAFVTGAVIMLRLLREFKLQIDVPEMAIVSMAQMFYPPYDPLPDPVKANDAGNAPPLAIPRK